MHCALLDHGHMARSAPLGGAARGSAQRPNLVQLYRNIERDIIACQCLAHYLPPAINPPLAMTNTMMTTTTMTTTTTGSRTFESRMALEGGDQTRKNTRLASSYCGRFFAFVAWRCYATYLSYPPYPSYPATPPAHCYCYVCCRCRSVRR